MQIFESTSTTVPEKENTEWGSSGAVIKSFGQVIKFADLIPHRCFKLSLLAPRLASGYATSLLDIFIAASLCHISNKRRNCGNAGQLLKKMKRGQGGYQSKASDQKNFIPTTGT